MPAELRRILFSRDELREALAGYYGGASGRPWPAGEIRSVRAHAPSDAMLSLEIGDGVAGRVYQVDLDAEWVAAALIRFCVDRRIVLPRRAQKSLEILGDTVSLEIAIQTRTLLKIIGEPK